MRRLPIAGLRVVCASALLFFCSYACARAVPVFANGQGVSCETCHTTFPGMTRYGMMVMMTNFQILQRHLQDKALPLAVRLYITSYLANKSQGGSTSVSDLSLLSGGFLGRNFTYYAEQHVIDSSTIGATEQAWVSWNGLFHGTNSLQLGKYHTPFPFMPAHAWTLGNYLLATQTTGQNDWNPNEARWGAAFNGMSNEFMYNFAYLTNSGPTGNALDYNSSNNAPALDLNVSYGGMAIPFSVGLVGVRGWAPLHAAFGRTAGSDPFTREGAYFGYQDSAWHFQTMYYHGYDAQPNLNEFGVSLNGFFFEAERDLGWRNHVLLRYDVASSDTLNRQYVLDVSHNLAPNLALIGEALAGPAQRPRFGFELAFAGPYRQGQRFLWEPQGGGAAPKIAVVPVNAAAPAAAAPVAPAAVPSGDVNAGAKLVQANGCTGCHGATFHGGLGPALYGIEHRLEPQQIVDRIEHPVAPMPNFGFTPQQAGDIAAYLSDLDGGAAHTKPLVTFVPETPSSQATIIVRFTGTPPHDVSALALMQMGNTTMHATPVILTPSPTDPAVFTGVLRFSMGGPWIVRLRYGTQTLDVPLQVSS